MTAVSEIRIDQLKRGQRYPFDTVKRGTVWVAKPLVAESIRNAFAQYAKRRGIDMQASTRADGQWSRITFR